jgi:hypothetical protein
MIQKHFQTPVGPAKLCFVPEFVTVVFDPGTVGSEDDAVSVPWDKLDDMEFLADAFGHVTVKVFRSIVEQLGVVYANRHIYEALL